MGCVWFVRYSLTNLAPMQTTTTATPSRTASETAAFRIALKKVGLSGAERDVLDTIRDRDYFRCNAGPVNLRYFIVATGLSKGSVSKCLASLRQRNMIIVREVDGGWECEVAYDPKEWRGPRRARAIRDREPRVSAGNAAKEVFPNGKSERFPNGNSKPSYKEEYIYNPKGNENSSAARAREEPRSQSNEPESPPPRPPMANMIPADERPSPVPPPGAAAPPPLGFYPEVSTSLRETVRRIMQKYGEMNHHRRLLQVQRLVVLYGLRRTELCLQYSEQRATLDPFTFAQTILAAGDEPWLGTGGGVTTVDELATQALEPDEREFLRAYIARLGLVWIDAGLRAAKQDAAAVLEMAARIAPDAPAAFAIRVVEYVAKDPYWGPKKPSLRKFRERFGSFVNSAKASYDNPAATGAKYVDVNEIIRQRRAKSADVL